MLIASTCLVPPALFLLPAAGCGSARTRAGWGDRAGNHDRRRQPAVCSSRLESEIEPAGRSERFSVRPDTWQPRVASNGAGAHRFGRRPCPMASNPVDPLVPAGAFAPPRRGLRILAGARYRWRCAREERCRGVAGESQKLFSPGGAAFRPRRFRPIIEDGQPHLHPAGRSSLTFAELDREAQRSSEKPAVPR